MKYILIHLFLKIVILMLNYCVDLEELKPFSYRKAQKNINKHARSIAR